ncbi:MAG: hypothetical protein KAV82_00365 [Phycisphaerae bacterium]|nr:hypothetical protein [Phycisphaerae bacterium]
MFFGSDVFSGRLRCTGCPSWHFRHRGFPPPPMLLRWLCLSAICLTVFGCGAKPQTPMVIFLDGAGHFGYAGRVHRGLRQGGFEGRFQSFMWTSLLGPAVDHLVVARAGGRAGALARRIERIRAPDNQGRIHLIGLSAGTAVVVAALERLDNGVMVDNVVLLSSSLSARRNLTPALRHVQGHFYVTASRGDGILSVLPVNADGGSGPPAGRTGVQIPRVLANDDREQYRKVVNLPWKPAYAGTGWDGGHTRVTSPKFIEKVIAPRLRSDQLFPLDRPLYRQK